MQINSIEELKQLAGMIKPTSVTSPTVEPVDTTLTQSDCGCGTKDMRKYMDVIPFSDIKVEDEDLEEWANSTDHFDGEPRTMDQPKGEIVDTSLRRLLRAKGDHVTVDESKVNEGIKDKLKVIALLGLTGLAGMQLIDRTGAANSPLGKAMQQAAQRGDDYAAEHLKKLDSYVDANSPMLRTLNQLYIEEQHTPDKMLESYNKFKNNNVSEQSTGINKFIYKTKKALSPKKDYSTVEDFYGLIGTHDPVRGKTYSIDGYSFLFVEEISDKNKTIIYVKPEVGKYDIDYFVHYVLTKKYNMMVKRLGAAQELAFTFYNYNNSDTNEDIDVTEKNDYINTLRKNAGL